MRTAVICFSEKGSALALDLAGKLSFDISCIHSVNRFAGRFGITGHESISRDMGELFNGNDALIFISAAGIAVRLIAPFIKDKTEDPAVIVIDDGGRFVIPVLSGHIGGANRLAREIADMIGAKAVITTATDGAGKFACDEWAKRNGCVISSMETAKLVSSAILEHDVPVVSEFRLPDVLPNGLIRGESGEIGIYIGIKNECPFEKTLRLIPRAVTLGIGLRRGIPEEDIENAVRTVFDSNGIDIRSLSGISTIDVKKDEQGLIGFAEKFGLPVNFYSAAELDSVEGDFEESEFVRKTVGVGNVCERASAIGGGRLIIRKTAINGVTVAAASVDWRVMF